MILIDLYVLLKSQNVTLVTLWELYVKDVLTDINLEIKSRVVYQLLINVGNNSLIVLNVLQIYLNVFLVILGIHQRKQKDSENVSLNQKIMNTTMIVQKINILNVLNLLI